jgi:ATP-binding cassette subfamily B protein
LTPPAEWTPMQVIAVIAGAVLLMAALRAVLNYFYAVSVARLVQQNIVVHLRARVYDKLQRLSFRFFDANATGSIINRVTSDTQATRMFIDGVLLQGIMMLLSLTVYAVYMVSIHPTLTLACLATAPVILLVSAVFSKVVRPAYVRNRELMDHLVLVLSETVQGIPVIKGFAREPEADARFSRANRAVCDHKQRIFWRVSAFTPTIDFITQVNMIILLLYGGYLVIYDALPVGTGLIVFAGLLQHFSAQVANITNIANNAQESLTAARRVFEILDAPVEIQSKPKAVRLPKADGAVRFEHVWFEFHEADSVLEDVDFEARPGQCVAVLGPTGAGKSALMSLIPRFYDPRQGRVLLDGIDARDIALEDLRHNIGIVFQESFLFSNTVAANIAFGHPSATREQIYKAATIAAAHEFITQLPKGYDTILGEGGSNLSGGQRQRLAIARAVLLEPSILLLDDPTAAIDPETEHEIMAAMSNAMKGRTTFIVAHRLSTLRRADVILVLDKGRIVQRGSHEALMSVSGPYRRVAELQLAEQEGRQLLNVTKEGFVS